MKDGKRDGLRRRHCTGVLAVDGVSFFCQYQANV